MDYGPPHGNHPKPKSGSKQKRVRFKIHHKSNNSQDSFDTLSPSSSSSSALSDESFQTTPHILPKLKLQNKPHLSNEGAKLEASKNEDIKVPGEAMSPGPTSQSPTQSPPLQLMEKNREFDPNQIPASVFSTSSTPTECSTPSNDSLFSICMGDSSLSRDHVSRSPKAGELLNSRELSELPKESGELIRFGPTDPNFKEVEPYFDIENNVISRGVKPEKTRVVVEPNNGGLKRDLLARLSRDSHEGNRHCDQSEACARHFANPVKEKSSSCPLCHCHSCCRALFCCTCLTCSCKWLRWPTCSFKWCVWPSFSRIFSSSHCKCPNFSCHCCNCFSWSCCNWSCCKCSCCASVCCCWNSERNRFSCSSPTLYASSVYTSNSKSSATE